MAFCKHPALHTLKECHGIDLECARKTNDLANVFNHYIAGSQCQSIHHSFRPQNSTTSLTDVGNVEDELLILYCVQHDAALKVR